MRYAFVLNFLDGTSKTLYDTVDDPFSRSIDFREIYSDSDREVVSVTWSLA